MAERLQKLLAEAGQGSRRQIEALIADGRISVNGVVAKLGDRAGPEDLIRIDGRVVRLAQRADDRQRVLIYHKPEGEVCTRSDPEGRPTVFDRLPKLRSGRWIAVGRLDINTCGLLLLTTDGELANRLMHPSSEIEREYAVRVLGEADEKNFAALTRGVMLDDGLARFASIQDGGGQGVNHWYHVTLKEGRKREVRRLWESQGLTVNRLIRVRFGPVRLHRELAKGKWETLDREGVNALRACVGMAPVAKNEKVGKKQKYRPSPAKKRTSAHRRSR